MEHGSLSFSLAWLVPFGGLLVSLGLMPVIAPTVWHRFFGLIIGGWITIFLLPFGVIEGCGGALHMLLLTIFHHYVPFMAILIVLFTATGGIHVKMQGRVSPLLNVSILGTGALLANVVGTTGASMLLVRPLIALNRHRHYKTHLIIFFIFLVANIGGVLTPLGDAPLFVGFLNGIDFFWTTHHLIVPFVLVGGATLLIFWVIDHYYFYHDSVAFKEDKQGKTKIWVKGWKNFVILGISIAIIFMESSLTAKPIVTVGGLPFNLAALGRDSLLLLMAYVSWKITPVNVHEANHFTWKPLEEVAVVFLGIFITVIPVLEMLKAGEAGPLGGLVRLANPNGIPDPGIYFWLTGIFSSILDNAPTYLVFFNMAGADAPFLMAQGAPVLAAISTGAVFMGALTYIGNAPNFMIRSIAVHSHVKMPGFFGYLLWSLGILLPIFGVFSWLWI